MLRLFPTLIAISLLCGCMATQQDVLQIQSQMDDLSSSISSLRKNQADLALKIDGLSRQLNSSSVMMTEIGDRMSMLSAKLTEIDSSFSTQLTAIDSTVNKKVNAMDQNIREQIKKQQEQVDSQLLPSRIYNDAHTALANKNYDGAAAGFREYIKDYPQTDLSESAYFYLGEALFSMKNWEEAAQAYASVIADFPRSMRTAAARLKYAEALLSLPQPKEKEALAYLKSVIKEFPASSEAEEAGRILTETLEKKNADGDGQNTTVKTSTSTQIPPKAAKK